EDMDRYDAPSRDVVTRLLADPGNGALSVVATRLAPGAGAGPRPSRAIEVAPLLPSEIAEWVALELGAVEPDLVTRVVSASGGIPLAVLELIRFAKERGLSSAEPLPSLVDALGGRLARLPRDARALIQLMAVSGGEIDAARAAAVGIDLGRGEGAL